MPNSTHAKPYLHSILAPKADGRVLAHLQSGILTTEEVHRFRNEPVEYGGSLHWDVPDSGSKCGKLSRDWAKWNWPALESTHGVWTMPCWESAASCCKILTTIATAGPKASWKKSSAKISKEEIYQATGIQFMPINTLYQLFAARRETPKLLAAAKHLLTIPDLFNYWLTGNAVCEFTNATTTQMVDPVKRTWATSLMQRLDLAARICRHLS